jgi:hypothetical protein
MDTVQKHIYSEYRPIFPLGYFLEGSRDRLLKLNTRAYSVSDSSQSPWSRILETRNRSVAQLVNTFHAFSGTRRFSTKYEVEMEEYCIEVNGRLHAPAVMPLEEGAYGTC